MVGCTARHGADGLLVFGVRIDRARRRRAALLHASQISPAAVLWRRLQLQGDCEHLRWIR